MSSREPMWYCHECHAEMRPLMQPDPICASCHGDFVEKIENPSDDPREFTAAPGHIDDDGMPAEMDHFLLSMHQLLAHGQQRPTSPGSPRPTRPTSPGISPSRGGPTVRIGITRSGPRGQSTFVLGGPNTLRPGPSNATDAPPLSEFMRRNNTPGQEGDNSIGGTLMMQYLMSMMSQRPGGRGDPLAEAFAPMFGVGVGGDDGRWGDYVFSQEALDRVMTQLMDNSNSSRPVPAPQEVVDKLEKNILEEGSPLLDRDCAVCKEQFRLGTEDPDEQVVVTLPCKHPFHETCIIPWLKSSGTCPVCRFALVAQPTHHDHDHEPGPPPGNSSRPGSPSNRARSPGPGANPQDRAAPGGFLSNLLSHISGNNASSGNSRRRSYPGPSRGNDGNTNDLPGGWSEPVD